MEDTRKELERIQNELFTEDATLDELLNDKELNDLLWEPRFDNLNMESDGDDFFPVISDEDDFRPEVRKNRDDRTVIALMATASVLCLGIIGVLAYWLAVLL